LRSSQGLVTSSFNMAMTYGSYLKLEELLALQCPVSKGPEHDELLFITIHQVYELWFKQMLHELKHAQKLLDRDERVRAMGTLKRVLTILKVAVAQVDILETMTPIEFNSFRSFLESSSGFQSVQFRELEMRLGYRSLSRAHFHPEGSPERRHLESVLAEPSFYQSFLKHLHRMGFSMPDEVIHQESSLPNRDHEEVRRQLIRIYREGSDLAQLCERLLDLDEGLQEWRYRHVKMVERTIGAKMGTGGSSGAEYLKNTLFRPLFADLWAIRSQL
jgi:tryptophan 2,3-dioxygenase